MANTRYRSSRSSAGNRRCFHLLRAGRRAQDQAQEGKTMRSLSRITRVVAPLAALLLIAAACGSDSDDTPEPDSPAETGTDEPADAAEEPTEEEAQAQAAERDPLYYPASELFLPDHPVDGLVVDFYASHNSVAETAAWFEANIEDLDAYDVEEAESNGELRWVIERSDAEPGGIVRIEVAHSTAHADIGLIAPISDSLPPDVAIIAIAFSS